MKGKLFYLSAVFVSTFLFGTLSKSTAQDAKTEPAKTQEKTGEEKKANPAATPKASNQPRHQQFLDEIKKRNGDIDVVLQGDSITDWWAKSGKAVYEKNFGPLKTLDIAIAGDTTQGNLWRMQNGELEGYKAKLMMLMIGTNNIGGKGGKGPTPEQIAEGIEANVKLFREKQPQAKVLLLGIFPRAQGKGGSRKWAESPQHDAIVQINKIISKLDDGKNVKYMDIGDKFLDKEGNLPTDVMADGLHPTEKGYQIWADAVMPTIHEMLGKKKD